MSHHNAVQGIVLLQQSDIVTILSANGSTAFIVNIGTGNGLVPDGTKPIPEPMLTMKAALPLAKSLGTASCPNSYIGPSII